MVEHYFQDAKDMERLSPATFKAPTLNDLAAIKPGMFVQVCANGEQFWTEITGISGQLVGAIVRNRVRSVPGVQYGDRITFERRHIYRIQQEAPPVTLAGRRH